MTDTISDDDYKTIKETLVESSRDDYVGLWQIPWWIERLSPSISAEGVKAETLRLVRDLLDSGSLRAGQVAKSGKDFEASNLSTDEIVDLIDTEWQRLGRPPNIGEVLWFDAMHGASSRLDEEREARRCGLSAWLPA